MAETVRKNLGMVTAYAYAVSKGYSGTEEEFAELMASYADVAQDAEASAQAAAQSATTAEQKATQAAGSATNAAEFAESAEASAQMAASSSNSANIYAQDASESATNAAGSASSASTYAGNASASALAAGDFADAAEASATQAAGSATTATAKAGEAATSATTAVEAAQQAEDAAATLVIDDTLTHAGQAADAKKTGDEIGELKENLDENVSELKNDLKQSDNELFRVSGYLNQNYVKGRKRYVDNGVEKFANLGRWISPAQDEYIELKSGDVIVVHQSDRYHFRVCYSTDNKATWIMTGETLTKFVMPSDAVGWIPIITTTTATDEDVETILNEHVIEIIRNGVNLVGSANVNVNGVIDALNISPNSGFHIEAIKDGTTFNYVNTTAAENGGTEKLFEIPCAKNDVFRIKFNFQAMVSPENFSDYYLMVREINENESSPLRNVGYKLSELQTAADFTVYYANTKKFIANVNLKRSSTTVSSGYYEEIKYAITVIKVLEQNDVYTEAGEAWEV